MWTIAAVAVVGHQGQLSYWRIFYTPTGFCESKGDDKKAPVVRPVDELQVSLLVHEALDRNAALSRKKRAVQQQQVTHQQQPSPLLPCAGTTPSNSMGAKPWTGGLGTVERERSEAKGHSSRQTAVMEAVGGGDEVILTETAAFPPEGDELYRECSRVSASCASEAPFVDIDAWCLTLRPPLETSEVLLPSLREVSGEEERDEGSSANEGRDPAWVTASSSSASSTVSSVGSSGGKFPSETCAAPKVDPSIKRPSEPLCVPTALPSSFPLGSWNRLDIQRGGWVNATEVECRQVSKAASRWLTGAASPYSASVDPRYLGMLCATADNRFFCFAFGGPTEMRVFLVVVCGGLPVITLDEEGLGAAAGPIGSPAGTSRKRDAAVAPPDDAILPIIRGIFDSASAALCNPFLRTDPEQAVPREPGVAQLLGPWDRVRRSPPGTASLPKRHKQHSVDVQTYTLSASRAFDAQLQRILSSIAGAREER